MSKGIDSTDSLLSHVQAVKANGCSFAGRYYSNNEETSLTSNEARQLIKAGIGIVAMWNNNVSPDEVSYFTYDAGYSDGTTASNLATAIGQPTDTPIYFIVDYDATEDDINKHIIPYFHGLQDAFDNFSQYDSYELGVYGSGAVCHAIVENASNESYAIPFTWLALNNEWSGYNNSTAFNIKQQPGQYLINAESEPSDEEDGVTDTPDFNSPYVHYNFSPGGNPGAFTSLNTSS